MASNRTSAPLDVPPDRVIFYAINLDVAGRKAVQSNPIVKDILQSSCVLKPVDEPYCCVSVSNKYVQGQLRGKEGTSFTMDIEKLLYLRDRLLVATVVIKDPSIQSLIRDPVPRHIIIAQEKSLRFRDVYWFFVRALDTARVTPCMVTDAPPSAFTPTFSPHYDWWELDLSVCGKLEAHRATR